LNPHRSGYMYTICDLCGRKRHQKDTLIVSDIYDRHNGLLICKEHKDQPAPGVRPLKILETITSTPKYVRRENTDRFVVNANDDRLPGKPREVRPQASTLGSYVDVYWTGPDDVGSSAIIGYQVTQYSPQLGNPIVVAANTSDPAGYFRDTTANVNSEYSYTIAAINSFGTGPESEPGYYPHLRVDTSIVYLSASQGSVLIANGGADTMIISPEV